MLDENQKIVLWGTGTIGTRIMEGKYGKYDIQFVVDSKIKSGQTECVNGIQALNPDILLDRKKWKDCILVLGIAKWQQLADIAEDMGLKIFEDYIPYCYLMYDTIDIGYMKYVEADKRQYYLEKFADGKKVCGLYGLCHMLVYKQLLLLSDDFVEKYVLLDIPILNDMSSLNHELLWEKCLWLSLDVLILGNVVPKENNAPGYREVIGDFVRKDCNTVLVTNAAFKGYFPQHCKGIEKVYKKLCWGDKNLNIMVKQKKSPQEAYTKICDDSFYDVSYVNGFFEHSLKELQELETHTNCDVMIADYIRNYGKEKILYYSTTHPCTSVMIELAKRILRKMNLSTKALETIKEEDVMNIRIHGEIVYPSVCAALGIDRIDALTRKVIPGDDRDVSVTLEEYVELYMNSLYELQ